MLIAALLPGAGAWAVFCPVCGQDRGDTYKFCPADGTDLGAIRSQVRGDRPRGQATPGPDAGNVPTQEPLPFIPTLPEEVKENQIVVDLLSGELLSSRTRISGFTNGALERLVGTPVPRIMKKMSPQGDEMWAYAHNNIYLEKYARRQDGKLMLSRTVGSGLPKAADWTQDKVLDRAARLAHLRDKLRKPGPPYDILTSEGLSFGMKASKARALFQGRLRAVNEGGMTLVFDREKVSKGFLTLTYQAPRKIKANYAVELIFDKDDELVAIRCGNLKQK